MLEENATSQPRYHKLAAGLKNLRGKKSLQLLADESEKYEHPFSTSTLHRYESGNYLPKLQDAEIIDSLYNAHGWAAQMIRLEYAPTYNPWNDKLAEGKKSYLYSWPPEYNGLVSVHIWPLEYDINTEHQLKFTWGPWHYNTNVILDESGIAFISGQAQSPDNASLHLEISCNKYIFALFALGDADHGNTEQRDIRKSWVWTQ